MLGSASVLLALILDRLLGEPRRYHPLVGFGTLAASAERHLYRDSKRRGVIAVLVLMLPLTLLTTLIQFLPGAWLINIVLLYLALGGKSLCTHAELIREALVAGNLPLARQRVSRLVSRETRSLDEQGVARATVESVLENGNDAIFAAIFWFMVAGGPGVVLYRLANTLDAMWGYRNKRYMKFGWAAARLDDGLNYLPARLTALAYALAGQFRHAISCWKRQGSRWKSPNAGPVMASGAGSLGVVLGGPEIYHGQMQYRPELGMGRPADTLAIKQAQALLHRALSIWVLALILLAILWSG